MMDLDEFSRQLESMHRRFMQLCPGYEPRGGDLRALWEETSEALGVTVEEMRVVEEELRQQNGELEESRLQVEKERQRYRELFDFAPDGYLVTDLHGVIREANKAAGELFGAAPRYLANKPLANYVEMGERMAFRGGLLRLPRVGRREQWHVTIRPRRGEPFVGSLTVAVIREVDGTPVSLRWIIREIGPVGATDPRPTGRVSIGLRGVPARVVGDEAADRRALEDEAEALRRLVHGLDLIVWEGDPRTGRCWYISPRAEAILGYPPESWTDLPDFWREILHVEDRAVVESHRRRCLGEGKGGELEYRLHSVDGRVIWFRESLCVDLDGDGRPAVARGCLWDITRRKKVERQLYTDRRKLAEHLSDVWHLYLLGGQLLARLESGPVLEEILSAVASLQGAEMGVLRLLDRDRDELEAVVDLGLPPEYRERYARIPIAASPWGQALRLGETVIVEDIEADPLWSGWVEASRLGGFRGLFVVPLIGRDDEPMGTICTFFREPHRPSPRQLHLVEQYVRQAADALDGARRHEQARDSDRSKEEFLATLAHELRNPLAAIATCMHLLRPGDADAETIGEARDIINRQVRHMSRLVEDLLDATRISRGTIRLRKERVDLAEVLARALEHARPILDARRHKLILNGPGAPIVLEADPTRLEQVLANLLTNAAKYTDSGGRIEVATALEADEAVIRVRDNGIGLEPQALVGLFRLFSQVDASHDRSFSGLGIGLALVKSLVELHGGTVCASSEGPGRGSEFTVRLPL